VKISSVLACVNVASDTIDDLIEDMVLSLMSGITCLEVCLCERVHVSGHFIFLIECVVSYAGIIPSSLSLSTH